MPDTQPRSSSCSSLASLLALVAVGTVVAVAAGASIANRRLEEEVTVGIGAALALAAAVCLALAVWPRRRGGDRSGLLLVCFLAAERSVDMFGRTVEHPALAALRWGFLVAGGLVLLAAVVRKVARLRTPAAPKLPERSGVSSGS
jgi:hypothetical protein